MTRKLSFHAALVAFAALALASAGWAKTYLMQASSITPGAVGKVDANFDKNNGNTQITVKAEHLAKPTLLTPTATSYVVWVQADGGQPVNQGVLSVGDGEKGDTKLTTTASKFSLFITAENDPHPAAPSDRVILRTNVQE